MCMSVNFNPMLKFFLNYGLGETGRKLGFAVTKQRQNSPRTFCFNLYFQPLNHFIGNDTEVLLANISLSVNLTKQIKRENDQAEQFLLNKTAILERKLKAAKDKVAKVLKLSVN